MLLYSMEVSTPMVRNRDKSPNPNYDNIVKYYKEDKSLTYSYSPGRYDKVECVIDEDGNKYRSTYEPTSFPVRQTDHYYVVEPKYANRLDLVAYKFYHNPLLYWIIAEASNINNPLDLPVGTLLRVPDYQALYGYNSIF